MYIIVQMKYSRARGLEIIAKWGYVYTYKIVQNRRLVCRIQLHPFNCLHGSIFISRFIGMWAWRFKRACWYHASRTKQQRKQKYFFIKAFVGLLMVFSAAMKAEVRVYQNCVSVFGVYTSVFYGSVFEVSTKVSVFRSLRFRGAYSSYSCKREA